MTRTATYTETITLQELTCCDCGIFFAVPINILRERYKGTKGFHCPNGHSLTWGTSESAKLQEQLQAEQERRRHIEAQLTHANDQLKATRSELQRHKKRTANGVCPCCNRTFSQLQRHMKSQHPEHVTQMNK